jgi:hypothetical protein
LVARSVVRLVSRLVARLVARAVARLVARLAMVSTGKEMPAVDEGDAEFAPYLEEKRGTLFGGCGQLQVFS